MLFVEFLNIIFDFFLQLVTFTTWKLTEQRRVNSLSNYFYSFWVKITHLDIKRFLEYFWHCRTNPDGQFLFLSSSYFSLHWGYVKESFSLHILDIYFVFVSDFSCILEINLFCCPLAKPELSII